MDLLLDKRSKRLLNSTTVKSNFEHENTNNDYTPTVIRAAENDEQDFFEPPVSKEDIPEEVKTQGTIPIEVVQQNNQPISPESEHDTSTEIETIQEIDPEIQEITIKSENLSDEPEENFQEVVHHKSGPIREEGPDYIIYRPERREFEKVDGGGFRCSDCDYSNQKYSLGRVSI